MRGEPLFCNHQLTTTPWAEALRAEADLPTAENFADYAQYESRQRNYDRIEKMAGKGTIALPGARPRFVAELAAAGPPAHIRYMAFIALCRHVCQRDMER